MRTTRQSVTMLGVAILAASGCFGSHGPPPEDAGVTTAPDVAAMDVAAPRDRYDGGSTDASAEDVVALDVGAPGADAGAEDAGDPDAPPTDAGPPPRRPTGFLVTAGLRVLRYDMDLTLVETTVIDPPPADDSTRDIVVDATGRMHVWTEGPRPVIRTREVDGTWSARTYLPNWITPNNLTYGALATRGDVLLAAAIQQGSAGRLQGLVRFDLATGATDQPYDGEDAYDIAFGLDGGLYVLTGTRVLTRLDPVTFVEISSVSLAEAVRGVAIEADGTVYGTAEAGMIVAFDRAGSVMRSIDIYRGFVPSDIDLAPDGTIVATHGIEGVYLTSRELTTIRTLAIGGLEPFVVLVYD